MKLLDQVRDVIRKR